MNRESLRPQEKAWKLFQKECDPRQQLSETYERNGLPDEERDIIMAAKLRRKNLGYSDESNAGPREESWQI